MGNTFGEAFRVTTFGESHGGGLGAVIDGCPPGLSLDMGRVQRALDRRRPGRGPLVSPRAEPDRVELLSGVFEGKTLGTPIGLLLRNRDADPSAYAALRDRYRPSHADYTYEAKYGHRAWAGGGRASARETAARVAAGAVALQVLETLGPVEIVAWVDAIHTIRAQVDPAGVAHERVEASPIRCPDPEASARMEARVAEVRERGDTVGGVVRAVARGIPAGLGEPVFHKLDALLGAALLSIPAAKGVEIGSGFGGTVLTGLEHNDPFEPDGAGGIRTTSNRSGGIQGGISNGMPIEVAVAFKPVSTVFKPQRTVDRRGRPVVLEMRGRHDPCVVPRAVPVVEAMMALVLVDAWLRWRGQVGTAPAIPLPAEGAGG